MGHGNTGHALEKLSRQVRAGAIAWRSHVQFPGISLRIGNQFIHIFDRQRIVDDDGDGRLGDHRDRLDVLDRVVGKFVVDRWRDCLTACRAQQQHLPGRRRLREFGSCDGTAAARLVFDDHRRLDLCLQRRRNESCDDVIGPARREPDHHPDRRWRQVLGECQAPCGAEQDGRNSFAKSHGVHAEIL